MSKIIKKRFLVMVSALMLCMMFCVVPSKNVFASYGTHEFKIVFRPEDSVVEKAIATIGGTYEKLGPDVKNIRVRGVNSHSMIGDFVSGINSLSVSSDTVTKSSSLNVLSYELVNSNLMPTRIEDYLKSKLKTSSHISDSTTVLTIYVKPIEAKKIPLGISEVTFNYKDLNSGTIPEKAVCKVSTLKEDLENKMLLDGVSLTPTGASVEENRCHILIQLMAEDYFSFENDLETFCLVGKTNLNVGVNSEDTERFYYNVQNCILNFNSNLVSSINSCIQNKDKGNNSEYYMYKDLLSFARQWSPSDGSFAPIVKFNCDAEELAYKITLVSGDGNKQELSYTKRSYFNLPKSGGRLGYTIVGWQTKKGVKYDLIDGKYLVANRVGNMVLYSEEAAKVYNLYFTNNGGEVNDESYVVPTTYTIAGGNELPTLKKKGYNFEGWFLDKDFTTEAFKVNKEQKFELKAGYTGDRRIYAKFTPITYIVKYILNEGELEKGYPEKHTLINKLWLPEPTREGYRFEGWYLTEDFSGEAIKGIEKDVDEDVTVYAKWKSLDEIKAEEDAKQAEKDAQQAEEDKKVHDAKPDYLTPTKEEDNKVEEVKASDVKTEEYKAPAEKEIDYNELTSELESYKVKFVKVRNKRGKKLKITWGKSSIKDCNYEIEVSTSKKFKKVSKKWKSAELTKVVSSKSLKTGGKYYVRVRAFKTINNKVVYGKWSVAKVIRIKKK